MSFDPLQLAAAIGVAFAEVMPPAKEQIAAEPKELEGQLATLRTRFGISWSIY